MYSSSILGSWNFPLIGGLIRNFTQMISLFLVMFFMLRRRRLDRIPWRLTDLGGAARLRGLEACHRRVDLESVVMRSDAVVSILPKWIQRIKWCLVGGLEHFFPYIRNNHPTRCRIWLNLDEWASAYSSMWTSSHVFNQPQLKASPRCPWSMLPRSYQVQYPNLLINGLVVREHLAGKHWFCHEIWEIPLNLPLNTIHRPHVLRRPGAVRLASNGATWKGTASGKCHWWHCTAGSKRCST